LEEHLSSLQPSYMWNIFKQLFYEVLEKAGEISYKDLEQ
jgi:hypothetical protein